MVTMHENPSASLTLCVVFEVLRDPTNWPYGTI
jgi:hypothetical protein